jgi:hypothetical protein
VRFLGIYITENLKYNVLVHSLCSGLSIVSYTMKSLKTGLNAYMQSSIYFANLQLHCKYGIIFWRGDSERKMAFKVQKRVI